MSKIRHAAPVVSAILVLALGSPATAAPTKPSRNPFPVTITAANGKVTLRHRPVRIVSLSPTSTEDLFAIGAGRQVVAVDDQSNYPKKAPHTKLSGYTPNAEAIAGYRPDLVVASSDANGLFAALKKLHVPVLLEPAAKNLNGAYLEIQQLGVATGHRQAARALVAKIRGQIKTIVASAPSRSLSVYHELSPDYYSATSSTFIGQVYKLFGLRNIADAADKTGSGYPQLSGEYIVSSNPDLIVLADTKCCGQSQSTVAGRAGWSTIAALQHGGVVAADDDIASRWGPRIVNCIRLVAAKVRAAP